MSRNDAQTALEGSQAAWASLGITTHLLPCLASLYRCALKSHTKYATRREKCALRALYLACRLSHLCAKVSVVCLFSLLATYCFFCILVEFISSCHFFSHYLLPNVVQVARTTDDLNLAARFALCMFMILFKIQMNCGLWIQNCKT